MSIKCHKTAKTTNHTFLKPAVMSSDDIQSLIASFAQNMTPSSNLFIDYLFKHYFPSKFTALYPPAMLEADDQTDAYANVYSVQSKQ